ncbi:MAG TPA: clan AA aspartic protease [Campylobacterales bacterium]|nr:clan AA aspartic protease [Campylobacterales bacterium]
MKKKIIGSIERISILDLELYDLDAKVDTGADSNALHCDDIRVDSQNKVVYFKLLDEVHPAYHGKAMSMPLHQIKRVKSSNGLIQERPSIKVEVAFFGKRYKTVISLTDRSDMKYPMLIGKKFMEKRFLVDVSENYLAHNNAQKEEE